jgi:hypothetical protein
MEKEVTHEELLAWINGAGLVNHREVTTTIDGEVQQEDLEDTDEDVAKQLDQLRWEEFEDE